MMMRDIAAVGVVIVEGPPRSKAAFTSAEETLVVTEVSQGIEHLVKMAPNRANLSFIIDLQIVNLLIHPDAITSESYWLDEAEEFLGDGRGTTGLNAYLDALKKNNSADWAYVAFFTKYWASRFAFARSWEKYCIIRYPELGDDPNIPYKDYGGNSPNDMDLLFAHETGHIFGAGDEYPSSTGNPAEDCLMRNYSLRVCQETAQVFGW